MIGINTAIYTGSRGFEGVGFALPSNTAINIYNQLVTQGHVTRGSIGIKFQDDQTSDVLLHRELGAPNGVVVQYVAPSGPASRAGIQPGDVITQINGHAVRAGSDLINPVIGTPVGHAVALSYVRNGKTKNVSVNVADMSRIFPEDTSGARIRVGRCGNRADVFWSACRELTPEISRHLGLSANQPGVIASDVEPASFADDIKFLRGEVIVEINHTAIRNLQDYKQEIAKLKPGEAVLFKVVHPDGTGQQYTVFHAGTIPRAGE